MRTSFTACIVVLFLSVLFTPRAVAVPSYARQTGQPCSACHYNPPLLNAAGRNFKLLGYVNRKKEGDITAEQDKKHAGLDLLGTLPLSAWLETSFISTKAPQPGTQNGNFEFPQDISLFLSGAWSTHLGSFMQITYDTQGDHFTMDNTDIRYARQSKLEGKTWVYGLTLNNNPTVEELWNSTPAWGFPFIESDIAPSPNAAPILQGTLGQDVAGVGAYSMWNEHLYFAGTLYRSAHLASTQPPDGQGFGFNIRGIAPYWRVAWQQNGMKNNLEVGTYGMHMKSSPQAITGPEDGFTDWAMDFQYDRILGKDVLSWRGTYLRENSELVASFAAGGASLARHHLNAMNTNVEYHFGNRYSTAVGWFSITGTADPLLFPQGAITGNTNGDPKSAGYILNFSYWPIQNVDLALQYTGYTRFNGAALNYDAAGRNANGNNAVYVLARVVF